MGILAGNSIIDAGHIYYDGKDLVKCKEKDFYALRGSKIGMIFQDPLSSLNPIMKIFWRDETKDCYCNSTCDGTGDFNL